MCDLIPSRIPVSLTQSLIVPTHPYSSLLIPTRPSSSLLIATSSLPSVTAHQANPSHPASPTQKLINGKQQVTSAVKPTTPVLVLPKLPLALPATKSWNTGSDGVAESLKMAFNCDGARSSRRSKTPHHVDGWYVAHCAILPGVYYGV